MRTATTYVDPRLALLMALPLATLPGCGRATNAPQRAAVKGAVWVDGKPLKRGSIKFIPTGGTRGPEAAAVIEDGFYDLPADAGPVVGTVRVEIRDAVDPGFALDDPLAFTKYGNRPLPRPTIPPEYNQRSTLTRPVQAGELNRFDFKIDTKRNRKNRR